MFYIGLDLLENCESLEYISNAHDNFSSLMIFSPLWKMHYIYFLLAFLFSINL